MPSGSAYPAAPAVARGLGIGADLKGRAKVTPPEASGSTSGKAAGTITHSDGVSGSMQNEAKGSANIGASGTAGAGGTSGGAEAKIRGETSGTVD